MVGKWHCKNPLTFEERKLIKEALDLDMSYSQMAHYVDRSKSTVKREAKRLGELSLYDPEKAQTNFEEKQKNCKRGKSCAVNVIVKESH